jgi:2-oxoglutarate ferredoxin oxidoreductase subunit alpha
MTIEFMKGNEVIGAAAIKAGCRYFFGYPITPQSELPEYMARELPKVGGVFLQAESEIAAINMVYGASGAGARVMTSSSSPGISLKMEGISYIAGAELPCLIVNIVRGGPGLGGIQPAQSDYFQAVKGGGHGDYRLVVLAPNSIQELSDLVMEGFDIADQYRNPVMILGDGMLGQMMEAVEFREPKKRNLPPKNWATSLNNTSSKKIINSLYIQPKDLENHNLRLHKKYEEIKKNETKYEKLETDDRGMIVIL